MRRRMRDLAAESPESYFAQRVRHVCDGVASPRTAVPIFTVLYTLAYWLQRQLKIDDVALMGAAVGVAFAWLYPWAGRRGGVRDPWLWLSVATIGIINVTISAITDMEAYLLILSALTNPVTALVTGRVYATLRHSRQRDLLTARDLALLATASFIGVAVAWCTLPLVAVLTTDWTFAASAYWFLRNLSSVFVAAVLAILFLGDHRGYLASEVRWRWVLTAPLLTVAVWSGLYFTPVFVVTPFLMLACSVVAAVRFSVLQCATYTITFAAALTALAVKADVLLQGLAVTDRGIVIHLVQFVAAWLTMSIALDREERAFLVHELQHDRAMIAEQAELMRAIVTSMNQGVLVLDGEGTVRMRNAAAARMLRGTPTGDEGIMHPLPSGGTKQSPPRPHSDLVLRDADGNAVRIVSVESHTLALSGRGDTVAIMRDVTDDRRQVAELRTFARVAAHDLRQPLSVIELWADHLRLQLESTTSEAVVESIDQIVAASERMDRFLKDLLQYSVARDGRLEVMPLDLQPLLDSVARDFALTAAGPAPRFTIDAPYVVQVDAGLVRQVFENLVGNAVKYTPHGATPTIDITAEPCGDGFVRVQVADRGIGVPEGQERLIFDEFHRVPEHAQEFTGTGLGLAICRRIVDRHRGSISAHRRSGGGTCFDVVLPA